MAFTKTKKAQYGIGNSVVQHWKITADAAGDTISTGLGKIDTVTFGRGSAATASRIAVGTLSAGTITIVSAASGDDFYMTVVGS